MSYVLEYALTAAALQLKEKVECLSADKAKVELELSDHRRKLQNLGIALEEASIVESGLRLQLERERLQVRLSLARPLSLSRARSLSFSYTRTHTHTHEAWIVESGLPRALCACACVCVCVVLEAVDLVTL